jgi:hypothetical protein
MITCFVGGSGAFACASGRLPPKAIASLTEKRGYLCQGLSSSQEKSAE